MKKIILFALSLFVIFSLCSCDSEAAASQNNSNVFGNLQLNSTSNVDFYYYSMGQINVYVGNCLRIVEPGGSNPIVGVGKSSYTRYDSSTRKTSTIYRFSQSNGNNTNTGVLWTLTLTPDGDDTLGALMRSDSSSDGYYTTGSICTKTDNLTTPTETERDWVTYTSYNKDMNVIINGDGLSVTFTRKYVSPYVNAAQDSNLVIKDPVIHCTFTSDAEVDYLIGGYEKLKEGAFEILLLARTYPNKGTADIAIGIVNYASGNYYSSWNKNCTIADHNSEK